MKVIYYSDRLRLKVCNRKSYIGQKLIVLKIQEKRWIFWSTVKSLDIEVENYWGYIPGHQLFGRCLRMSYRMGGYLEVWPPDIFDLKKRANEFLLEYYEERKAELLANQAVKKQMESI